MGCTQKQTYLLIHKQMILKSLFFWWIIQTQDLLVLISLTNLLVNKLTESIRTATESTELSLVTVLRVIIIISKFLNANAKNQNTN